MSRRKQAAPQQVQENLHNSQLVSPATDIVSQPHRLDKPILLLSDSACKLPSLDRRLQNELPIDRSSDLSREMKEGVPGNSALFSGPESAEQSIPDRKSQDTETMVSEQKYTLEEEDMREEGKLMHRDEENENRKEAVNEFSSMTAQGCDQEISYPVEGVNTVDPPYKRTQPLLENTATATSSGGMPGTTRAPPTSSVDFIENHKDYNNFKMESNMNISGSNGKVYKAYGEDDRNSSHLLDSASDSEKENHSSEAVMEMINRSQQMLRKENSDKNPIDETKELEKIKDQVKLLQQQQVYQVQMLNYLQFQLNFMASNPQSQQKSPQPVFPPNGLNGLSLQGMPHLLAAAASIAGNGNQTSRPTPNGFFPSMAAAINQQLSSSRTNETPQQIFTAPQNLTNQKYEHPPNSDERPNPKKDSYNPLSSLALLQNTSQLRANPTEALSENMELNDPGSKHVCRFCQKAFGSDSALQIHLRSHTGERPYKCNICANRFSTRGNLKVHFLRHKEKYPHIEMNPNPVPEYLDNIPTTTGIPYGMSIVPDTSDNKSETSDEMSTNFALGKRAVELPAPFQCIDNSSSREKMLQLKDFSNISEEYSEKTASPRSQDRRAREREHQDAIDIGQSARSYQNAMTRENFLEESNPLSHPSSSPARSDKVSRKPSSEFSYDTTDQSTVIAKSNKASSSETTKLQQLVEQIDKGKELEKNECHICHRILSCQSALKLHYRTHTGERPYKCDLCSRAFTTRGNLRTHYSSVHRQQLQSSTTNESSSSRGSNIPCPLCGSRFMDQQSFQQHMQMHLYMHNQQALQMMNGRSSTSQADYRMMGVSNAPFIPNLPVEKHPLEQYNARSESQTDQNNSENDEVFDDNVQHKIERMKEEAEPEMTRENVRSPSPRNPSLSAGEMDVSSNNSHNLPLMDIDPHAKQMDVSKRNFALQFSGNVVEGEEDRPNNAEGNGAILDLSRPSSNSSSSTSDSKRQVQSSPKNFVPHPSPMESSENSLSALENLATSGSTVRPNGVSGTNLQMSSQDARLRKMTTACEICNKPFTCQSALEIHLRSHTKERPFLCRVCERGFTTKGNLKQHLLTHNITDVDDEMLEPVASPVNEISIPCTLAAPPFPSTSFNQLKRPLDPLPSAPPAKRAYPRHWCHICQKQFSSASSLQIHNRTHTGEKPFACSVCGRAFTTKGNLKVHMGTHVWGAGGSRRGRRISMDNPLISPWMQNTSNTNASNPPLRQRVPPQLPTPPDQASIYQQYAALASGLIGAKAANDARFQNSAVLNLNAAKLLMPNNIAALSNGSAPTEEKSSEEGDKEKTKSMAEIATEWIWNAYKKSQEQGVN